MQLVNLRLTALGRQPALALAAPHAAGRQARERSREVWFPRRGAALTRASGARGIAPGTAVSGPAVIEALDSTTVAAAGLDRHSVDGQVFSA